MKRVFLYLMFGISFYHKTQAAESFENAEPWYESRLDSQNRTCVAFVEQESCNNQQICRVVCTTAGGAAGAAATGGVGTAAGIAAGAAICSELCETIPKCRIVPICTKWDYTDQ
jgi:hypothetical protein